MEIVQLHNSSHSADCILLQYIAHFFMMLQCHRTVFDITVLRHGNVVIISVVHHHALLHHERTVKSLPQWYSTKVPDLRHCGDNEQLAKIQE